MTLSGQPVWKKIVWGTVFGTIIGFALGVPITLLTQWFLDWHTPSNRHTHLMHLGAVSTATVCGIVLLAVLVSRLRMAALQDGSKCKRLTPDLRHALKLGGFFGLVIGVGHTLCFAAILLSIVEEYQALLGAWHLLAGIGVSIVYIAASGCVGALAAVAGFALAGRRRVSQEDR